MPVNTPVAEARRVMVPPEEKFWQRYSPHHEAPVSGVTSVVVHLLVILLLLGVVWLHGKLKIDEQYAPLPLDVVSIAPAGGDGKPIGKDDGPGGRKDGSNKEEDLLIDDRKGPALEHAQLTPATKQAILLEFDNDPNIARLLEKQTEQFKIEIGTLQIEARRKLREAITPRGPAGAGKDGRGPGSGPGEGTGKGAASLRRDRVLRWALNFSTADGKDYRNQLAGFGAIIGVPVPGKDGEFLLIRDLKNPAAARVEDISMLDRIYWYDDKPESVRSLFSILPQDRPVYFVAFFPESLEKDLLRKELAFTQEKYRTRDEGRIHQTKFDVIRNGDRYDVRVHSVELRR